MARDSRDSLDFFESRQNRGERFRGRWTGIGLPGLRDSPLRSYKGAQGVPVGRVPSSRPFSPGLASEALKEEKAIAVPATTPAIAVPHQARAVQKIGLKLCSLAVQEAGAAGIFGILRDRVGDGVQKSVAMFDRDCSGEAC